MSDYDEYYTLILEHKVFDGTNIIKLEDSLKSVIHISPFANEFEKTMAVDELFKRHLEYTMKNMRGKKEWT